MGKLSQAFTAKCTQEHYILYLLSEPKYGGCSRLAEILEDISHDSVNRFLLRERYSPVDLFESVLEIINLEGGILSVDDTVIENRIYDKKEGKTKNEYFREMVSEVIDWGLKPRMVTGDSWYSGVDNLKFLRNEKIGFLFGVERNRTVSNKPGKYCQVSSLEIPPKVLSLILWLEIAMQSEHIYSVLFKLLCV